jgi:predicted ester cyclase
MTVVAVDNGELVRKYLRELSGKPKTEEIIGQFVSDPRLKEHIQYVESAFPGYELIAEQLVCEGDTVALRGTFRGIHRGEFSGVPPTGRHVSAAIMLFYRLGGGKIVDHWMVIDMLSLMNQLNG